jgi:hypothetical protein
MAIADEHDGVHDHAAGPVLDVPPAPIVLVSPWEPVTPELAVEIRITAMMLNVVSQFRLQAAYSTGNWTGVLGVDGSPFQRRATGVLTILRSRRTEHAGRRGPASVAITR